MNALWILKGVAIGTVAIVILGFVVMYLWNWLAPRVFNLPTIQFKHAIGLLLLSKILFGVFGGGGHWQGHHDFNHTACDEVKIESTK